MENDGRVDKLHNEIDYLPDRIYIASPERGGELDCQLGGVYFSIEI